MLGVGVTLADRVPDAVCGLSVRLVVADPEVAIGLVEAAVKDEAEDIAGNKIRRESALACETSVSAGILAVGAAWAGCTVAAKVGIDTAMAFDMAVSANGVAAATSAGSAAAFERVLAARCVGASNAVTATAVTPTINMAAAIEKPIVRSSQPL